jgi:hypothetical protein
MRAAFSQKMAKSTNRRHLAFFPNPGVQMRRMSMPRQVSRTGKRFEGSSYPLLELTAVT